MGGSLPGSGGAQILPGAGAKMGNGVVGGPLVVDSLLVSVGVGRLPGAGTKMGSGVVGSIRGTVTDLGGGGV